MTMKTRMIAQIVLIATLYVCGASLVKDIQKLRSEAANERWLAESNKRLRVNSAAGIDTSGRVVYEVLPDGVKRIVVFGLRHASVHADTELWSEATGLLAKERAVHVIGYCDGTSCVDYLKHTIPLPPFTIIAYGQAAAAQAVVNADEQGAFVLLDGRARELRRVSWRRPALRAAEIVREVLK
jgi:hypothetical protein